MRTGICTAVISGDTIILEGGHPRLRYSNVWAPAVETPLGEAVLERNKALVLGKEVRYVPNGHIHWDNESIIAEVYVDDLWINQDLRYWLSRRTETPQWVDGIPGAENMAGRNTPPHQSEATEQP